MLRCSESGPRQGFALGSMRGMTESLSRPFTVERLEAMFAWFEADTFWRHDVDCSLESAHKMAKLENRLGVSATYYLMHDSPFYSPGQAFMASIDIAALGHRVGLHVDERRVDFVNPVLLYNAEQYSIPVSFHCPTEAVLWTDFPGLENAYAPEWEGRYYSDSGGSFRFGDPEDDLQDAILQINLHPDRWFAPEEHLVLPDDAYEAFFHAPKPATS